MTALASVFKNEVGWPEDHDEEDEGVGDDIEVCNPGALRGPGALCSAVYILSIIAAIPWGTLASLYIIISIGWERKEEIYTIAAAIFASTSKSDAMYK